MIEPVGQVQFVVFQKFIIAYHTKLHEKLLLLVTNFQGKNITERQNRRNFESVRVICNLNSCHNFALVLHENALFFSQSQARNFFMYTVT